MARKGHKVLLGFEDECIIDKHKSVVNFTTNKIGGKPDWPLEGVPSPLCQLCGLALPLVLQVYAPLENLSYHRTLYLFGCINPNCWNQNESWMCIRSQVIEAGLEREAVSPMSAVSSLSTTDWCSAADDWEDDNNANNNEENGNMIGRIESCRDRFSDEDDETEDYEDEVRVCLGNLSVDECNANWGSAGRRGEAGAQEGGAVGRLHSPSATAEIEGDESEVVSIDTPMAPQHDLVALLQEVAPLPVELRMAGDCDRSRGRMASPPQFAPVFISVGEEEVSNGSPSITPVSEHVRELLQEYQQNSEEVGNLHSPQQEKGDQLTLEKYEKSVPAHGDKMFYNFLSRLHHNPGQILRYCRDGGSPLLLYPILDLPTRCRHCHSEMLFEMQVVPTLIPKLRLLGAEGVHLEFGTVLVFTCRRSCWASDDTWREERIIVQAERM